VRCILQPPIFVPRYVRTLKLAYLVVRYDEKAPPLDGDRSPAA
jgi:hypothetical protein